MKPQKPFDQMKCILTHELSFHLKKNMFSNQHSIGTLIYLNSIVKIDSGGRFSISMMWLILRGFGFNGNKKYTNNFDTDCQFSHCWVFKRICENRTHFVVDLNETYNNIYDGTCSTQVKPIECCMIIPSANGGSIKIWAQF